jgi:exosortase D (VPLPA-CTERM-specific)
MLGNLAKIPDIVTYGFILVVGAFVLLLAGARQGLRFWPGWLHLIFMLPLPQFVYLAVSTKLQTLSSVIGVGFIQFAQIPVFLDGNIIDLGVYKLQVAEACSGLRYMFPLFSFGWLIAVLYNGPNWHRFVIFFSTVPITILMNSFRIGMIGILVDSYGIEQAEGFLHYFEGWIIFIACTLVLYAEAWVLLKFFSFGRSNATEVLRVDFEGLHRPLALFMKARSNRAFAGASVFLFVLGLAWQTSPNSTPQTAARSSFTTFPSVIGDWRGATALLDPEIARVLAANDYLVAGYSMKGDHVGLLMSYYKSQTEGSGIHSPEICLPGGGWEVSKWAQVPVTVEGHMGSQTFEVNRAIVQKGLDRQLVYYWFEEQGRRATNDYQAKFMTVWSTITSGRSDGGLVRLITPIGAGEKPSEADARLRSFLEDLNPLLSDYFPSNPGEISIR